MYCVSLSITEKNIYPKNKTKHSLSSAVFVPSTLEIVSEEKKKIFKDSNLQKVNSFIFGLNVKGNFGSYQSVIVHPVELTIILETGRRLHKPSTPYRVKIDYTLMLGLVKTRLAY